jgi:glycosyltransferase involved in cell wall biosynthesis
MTNALVSIVSVFYNRQNYVIKSVESLLNQDYKNIEIILVDDGSTDETRNLLESFSSFNNVTVISNKNKGFTASLVDGIGFAKGLYLAIHGSGDLSLPNRIIEQVQALEKDKEALFCGVGSNNIHHETAKEVDKHIYPRKKMYHKDFLIGTPMTHGCVMYRMRDYVKSGGYDSRLKYTQDWDLWLRMLKSGGYGVYVDQVSYSRVNFPNGASNSAIKAESQLMHGKMVHYLDKTNQADREKRLVNGVNYNSFDGLDDLFSDMSKSLSRRALRLKINGMHEEYITLKQILDKKYNGMNFFDNVACIFIAFLNFIGIDNIRISALLRELINIVRYWKS